MIERPERLIIGLVGIGFTGIGLYFDVQWMTYFINAAMWILAIGSIITVGQRLHVVSHAPHAREDFDVQH